MSINEAATRYLFEVRQFAFMPVPSETFVWRGRQNAGSLCYIPNEAIRWKTVVFTQPVGGASQVDAIASVI